MIIFPHSCNELGCFIDYGLNLLQEYSSSALGKLTETVLVRSTQLNTGANAGVFKESIVKHPWMDPI